MYCRPSLFQLLFETAGCKIPCLHVASAELTLFFSDNKILYSGSFLCLSSHLSVVDHQTLEAIYINGV